VGIGARHVLRQIERSFQASKEEWKHVWTLTKGISIDVIRNSLITN
jgi:hypothetical protein